MRPKILFILFSISLFSVIDSFAQPVWVASTPSVGTPGALTIPVNYGINQVGTVYIVVQNFDDPTVYTSAVVKSQAIAGPSGSIVYTAALPVAAGNINAVLQNIAEVTDVSTIHTIYLVAETNTGILQAVPVRLSATTKACPHIIILTAFTQPVVCINQGTAGTFQLAIPDPNTSGILKGTQWTIDWGDGTPTTAYTSVADNEIPPLAIRSHTYTTPVNCNYIFSAQITNPCGEYIRVQYVATVHGRDIPADGDGLLRIVNNNDGSSVINVCSGTQSVITLRDNSIWNCQNPVVPGGLTPVPNTDPRNLEWLYGRDPMGSLTNTITGVVSIGSLGNAPQTSGRITPVPYGSNSLSQTITIPATCQAGQYFRVYLKNWNKCNWTDPEYAFTYVDINVIASPPPPTVPNKITCVGDDRTLVVTSTPVGTIKWYSDAALVNQVATGNVYLPPQTLPGVYSYWVVDESTVGQLCHSQATAVTLTIYPVISNNSLFAAAPVCFGTVPNPLTGTIPSGGNGTFTYQWQSSPDLVSWNNISGATSVFYNPVTPLFTNTYYRRMVMSGPCFNLSNYILITVLPQLNPGTIGPAQTICFNTVPGSLIQITPPTGGNGIYTYQWQSSIDNTTWINVIPSGTGPVYSPPSLTVNTFYRLQVTSGNCVPMNSPSILIGVYPNLIPGLIGSSQSICYNTVPSPFTQISPPSGGMGIYSYQWQTSPDNSTWNNIPGATLAVYTPAALTATTFFRRQVTSGPCGTVSSPSITITVDPIITPGTIGSNQTICSNTAPAPLTQLIPPAGGTGVYTYQWQNSLDAVVWTNIAAAVSQGYSPGQLNTSTYYRRMVTSGSCGTVSSSPVLITVSSTLTLAQLNGNASICNNTATNLNVNITGGNPPFNVNYTRNGVAQVPVAGYISGTNFSTGVLTTGVYNYSLTSVTDATGCSAQSLGTSVTVTVGTVPAAATLTGNGPVSVSTPGTLNSVITGGAPPYTLTISGFSGSPVVNYVSGANISLGVQPPGIYNYSLTSVVDACANVLVAGLPVNYSLVVNSDLTPGAVGTSQTICYNTTPAGLTELTSPTGGTGTYNYQWQSSPDNTSWINIAGAVSATYSPGALTATTYYRRNVTSGTSGPVSSAPVMITVYPDFTAGSIGSYQTICYNSAPAALTQLSAPAGGTGTYTYQWQSSPNNSTWSNIASGGTSATYSPGVLTANTYYRRNVTSDPCGTVNSSSVLITVTAPLVGGSIGSNQIICYGGDVAPFISSAPASGGGGAITYTWQYTTNLSAIPGDANWTNIPASNSATFDYSTLTSTTRFIRRATDIVCAVPVYSNIITVTLRPLLNSGTIGSSQTICNGADVAAFTSFSPASGGSGAFTYTWQFTTNLAAVPGDANWTNIAGSNSVTFDYGTLAATTKFVRRAIDASCASPVYSNTITVTVRPNVIVDFSAIDPVKTNTGVPVVLNGNPTGGSGMYSQHLWMGDTGPLNSTTIQNPVFNSAVAGVYSLTYRAIDNAGCSGEDNLKVEVSVLTSIDDAGEIKLEYSVYPNPSTDFVILKIKNYNNNAISYQLFKINGILVQQKEVDREETMISIENLSSGTYFLKVTEKNREVKVFTIIKK